MGRCGLVGSQAGREEGLDVIESDSGDPENSPAFILIPG
jgi:hypothetical protein